MRYIDKHSFTSSIRQAAARQRTTSWSAKLTGVGIATALMAGFTTFGLLGGVTSQAQAAQIPLPPPAPEKIHYTLYPPNYDTGGLLTTVDDIETDSVLSQGPKFTGTSPIVDIPQYPAYVLAGDDVSWWIAVASFQGLLMNSQNKDDYVQGDAGRWYPMTSVFLVNNDSATTSPSMADTPDITGLITLLSTPAKCGSGIPELGTGLKNLFNMWCQNANPLTNGGGAYSLDLRNVTTADEGEISFGMTAVPYGGIYVSGPNNGTPGSTSTGGVQLRVVSPQLELIKQVCPSGTCTANDPTGWVDDTTAGDDNGKYGWPDGVPSGVEQGTAPLPAASSVLWRLTATNSGNIDLTNVHVAPDSDIFNGSAKEQVASSDCLTAFDSVDTSADNPLKVGASVSVTCTSTLTGPLAGTLQNSAALNADFDPTITAPPTLDASGNVVDGQPLIDRFTGNGGEAKMVPSNIDSAQIYGQPQPGIKLTKWVCKAGTGCTVPAAGSADLNKLAGSASVAGQSAGGWVKETSVTSGTDAEWLVVVTNIGTTNLTNITVDDTKPVVVEGGEGATSDLKPYPDDTLVKLLPPGQSVTYTATTSNIETVAPYVTGVTGQAVTIPANGISYNTGESAYNYGSDAVNLAVAHGQPTLTDGSIPNGPDAPDGTPGTAFGPIDSNESNAEVNAAIIPGIKLTKWVCETGVGCADPSPDDLATLAGTATVAGEAAGGWVKETTLPEGQNVADWLVVVTNTGDVNLANVTVNDPGTTGDGGGTMSTMTPTDPVAAATLAPGESVTFRATSTGITNVNPYVTDDDKTPVTITPPGTTGVSYTTAEPTYKTGQDVVNTATAQGQPVMDDGTIANGPDGNPLPVIPSNPSNAEVNVTATPGIKLTKWVCETGIGCDYPAEGSDELKTLAGSATQAGAPIGGWVKETTVPSGTDAQWIVIVTNTGNVPLKDISVADPAPTGGSAGDTTDLAAVGDGNSLLAQLLPPGESVLFASVTSNITNVNLYVTDKDNEPIEMTSNGYSYSTGEPTYKTGSDVVNTASATGQPVFPFDNTTVPTGPDGKTYGPIPSNDSNAEINVPVAPGIKLTKWVCEKGTGCVVPTDGSTVLKTLAGDGTTAGAPAGGWVKETNVPAGESAQWLVVVTNIGNVPLTNITVDDPAPTGDGAGTTSPLTAVPDDTLAQLLPPGKSVTYTSTTSNITNLNPYVKGSDEKNQTMSVKVGTDQVTYDTAEPTYNVGNDVVNTASATGTPVMPDGTTPAPGPDGKTPYGPIPSNTSNAEVNTPDLPGIKLTKWVCEKGTGCDVPPAGSAILKTLAGSATVAGEKAGGWVKETTVPAGTNSAQWLVIVTNIGNVDLKNIVVTDPDPKNGAGTTTELVAQDQGLVALLPVGQSVTYTSTTSSITNVNPYDTKDNGTPQTMSVTVGADKVTYDTAEPTYNVGNDVVNVASATGQPVLPDGKTPAVGPDGTAFGPIPSNDSNAEVNVPVQPGIKITKWVCGSGTGCLVPNAADLKTLGGTSLVAGAPAGGWVKETTVPEGTDAQWLIVVTNTGNVALANIVLDDAKPTNGAGETSAFTPSDPSLVDLLPPWTSVAYMGTTSDITNLNMPVTGHDDKPVTKTLDNGYSYKTGEPWWHVGEDVVNVASATGQPVMPGGTTPAPGPDGKPFGPIPSNDSAAEVHATATRSDQLSPNVPGSGLPGSGTPGSGGANGIETGGGVATSQFAQGLGAGVLVLLAAGSMTVGLLRRRVHHA